MRLLLQMSMLLVAAVGSNVFAHNMAPSLLEITNTGSGLEFFWKTPRKNTSYPMTPEFPEQCGLQDQVQSTLTDVSLLAQGKLSCRYADLLGSHLVITNIEKNLSPVLLRIKNGTNTTRHLLNREEPSFTFSPTTGDHEDAKGSSPFYLFLQHGFEHLLTGYDHLLFVICLLLLITPPATLIKAVTCFTLGHSLSLALAGLGYISLPSDWVELLIALSIVLLATEVVNARNKPYLLQQHPSTITLLFGLLHGLGFASVLADLQVAQNEFALSLLGFNLGIELGQLTIIALFLGAFSVFKMLLANDWPGLATRAVPTFCGYAAGAISALWVIERSQFLILT